MAIKFFQCRNMLYPLQNIAAIRLRYKKLESGEETYISVRMQDGYFLDLDYPQSVALLNATGLSGAKQVLIALKENRTLLPE